MSKSVINELREAQSAIDRAVALLQGVTELKSNNDSTIDWSKILARYDAPLDEMVNKAADEVKESFRSYDMAGRRTDAAYQEALDRAREAHFSILRRNGIDAPVADCNDPYGIKDLGKLSFAELYKLMESEDRPGPRRDAIASALQVAGEESIYGRPKPKVEETPPIPAIDGIARWAAKREHERGKPPADDPRPRAETIIVRDKVPTPLLRDDPGAGVYFKRRWWWPF